MDEENNNKKYVKYPAKADEVVVFDNKINKRQEKE